MKSYEYLASPELSNLIQCPNVKHSTTWDETAARGKIEPFFHMKGIFHKTPSHSWQFQRPSKDCLVPNVVSHLDWTNFAQAGCNAQTESSSAWTTLRTNSLVIRQRSPDPLSSPIERRPLYRPIRHALDIRCSTSSRGWDRTAKNNAIRWLHSAPTLLSNYP